MDDGLLVTLFHARLDLRSGTLRYVDAGHGHCALRRAAGGAERLTGSPQPLGADGQMGESPAGGRW